MAPVWVTLLYLAGFAVVAGFLVTDAVRLRREAVERRIVRGEVERRPPVVLRPAPPGAALATAVYPSAPPTAPVTLAEVIGELTLPCGLVPLTHARRPSAASEHVALATTACSASALRHALHAALAATGAEVGWDGDRGLVRRGGALAGIAVHAQPASAFPTAPPDAVVVELWVD